MADFRKGDVITVRATVKYDQRGEDAIHIKLEGHYGAVIVDATELTLVHHQFEIGERARNEDGLVGTVLAIDGGVAWLQIAPGKYQSPKLETLSHVDEPAEAELSDLETPPSAPVGAA